MGAQSAEQTQFITLDQSTMASSSNGNLVDDFEESFQVRTIFVVFELFGNIKKKLANSKSQKKGAFLSIEFVCMANCK